MLKKKFKAQTQYILVSKYFKNYNFFLINKSFSNNLSLKLLERIYYLSSSDSFYHNYQFFFTYYNTICLNSLSTKVPNKKYLFSRYFINNQYNKLTMSNILK